MSHLVKQDLIIIYCPCCSNKEATKIAKSLVEKKQIACANIVPKIKSIYIWEGKTQEEEECLLFLKTKSQHFSKVKKEIEALHSYKTPCVISLPIKDGNSDYLSWLSSQLS